MNDEFREIHLTQGKVAIVDVADYQTLNQHKWYYSQGYAHRQRHLYMVNGKAKKITILMHREIIPTSKDLEIDHWDGNGLNNRRYNLRESTNSQNQANQVANPNKSSSYKGVLLNKGQHQYYARIRINGDLKYLGSFTNELDAAREYNRAAIEFFGKFARLNDIPEILCG